MPLTNLLFLCSRNRLRFPTAEQVFAFRPGVETASAGLAPDAVSNGVGPSWRLEAVTESQNGPGLRAAYAQWQTYFDDNYDLGDVLDYL